ncbi:hypothetical protein GO730_21465 [Spirosoma sp. HMF3257]|uniref:Right handed beta helix domain-containing protein n=1 Tax=Spirosoma telluris TaxID=2183553 RepID=A0A327NL32_9BACT|nr:hypothetical protein [Spirosoma telluris]RAI76101.1 hypothetical protein HMF3257_21385 [Spirosoma telluris]
MKKQKFNHTKLVVLLLMLPATVFQIALGQTYYVASNGNDNNNGTSTSTPFQTIAKVNTLTLQAGSHVLFRRGDVFRGTLTVSQSGAAGNPIVIDAYGSGTKPTLSGSVLVTGWASIGNGKWQATCNSCGSMLTGLYSNSVAQPLGRYPNASDSNKGYLTVQSHVGKTKLISQQPLSTNWVGGEAVIRSNYFIIDRATITQQSSNTLTLTNTSAYNLTDQFGYFIQNHPATLDQQGEWYYDPSTKIITLYSNPIDPNTQTISVTTFSKGATALGRANITFNNLRIIETLNYGLYIENCSNITVTNCEVINSGENGVWFSGSGNTISFLNNLIKDSNNNGFQIDTYSNFTFQGNTIRRTALSPGRGKSGDSQYNAFIAFCLTGTLIESNTIDSTGYTALNFPKDNAVVRRNVVSNFCMTKNDGGGLYITNNAQQSMGNVTLQENIIYNGLGVAEGTPDGFLGANGIYLDECIQGINVTGNTTFKCSGAGIYLHGATNVVTTNNTSFDNNYTQFALDYTNICASNNNTTTGNIFVAKLATQYSGIYNSYTTNLSTFGTFDNNYYARPLDDVQSLRLSYPPPNGNLFDPQSLLEWQTKYGKDANSKTSPITLKGYTLNSYTGAERVVGGDFTTGTGFGSGGPFVFSDFNNGQETWDNTNRINGGSLNLNFTSITNNPGASLYAGQVINAVQKSKYYLIQFDAVSPIPNRLVQVYMQHQFAPFVPLVDSRPAVVVGTTPRHYEIVVKPLEDLANALAILRVFENNQPIYIDNFSVREVDITPFSPDDLMKLYYNPNARDTTITLSGTYRDVKNQLYSQQVTLSPFTSVVLLRDISPDLSPNISLPQSNFSTAPNNVRNFVVNIFEVGGQSTSNGTITMTTVVPTGYTLAFNGALTSIVVTGGDNTPVTIDNTKWTLINNVANQQISLRMNAGQFIPAGSKATLGFTVTRTSANSGSVSSITTNISNDAIRTYDGNSVNNVYSRIVSGL